MAKEQDRLVCAACGKLSPWHVFRERGYPLEVRTVRFEGGGRRGRPKAPMVGEDGREVLGSDGKPRMVLARDEEGKPAPGPGFSWSRRDLRPEERAEMVHRLRAVAARVTEETVTAELMNARPDEFEELCERYLIDAQAEVAARELLISEIRDRYHQRRRSG